MAHRPSLRFCWEGGFDILPLQAVSAAMSLPSFNTTGRPSAKTAHCSVRSFFNRAKWGAEAKAKGAMLHRKIAAEKWIDVQFRDVAQRMVKQRKARRNRDRPEVRSMHLSIVRINQHHRKYNLLRDALEFHWTSRVALTPNAPTFRRGRSTALKCDPKRCVTESVAMSHVHEPPFDGDLCAGRAHRANRFHRGRRAPSLTSAAGMDAPRCSCRPVSTSPVTAFRPGLTRPNRPD